jgi:sugar/nucleoside kinase (ribokinase family)
VVTDSIIGLARAANAGGRMIVGLDTKPEVLRRLSRDSMTGITFVKPNRAELFATLGMTDDPRSANHRAKDDTALTAAIEEWFGRDHDIPELFVTLGQEGMAVSIEEVTFYMPALGSQVVEVSGAGDTAIAAFMLGMLCSDGPESTLTFAAQAAAVAVGQSGTGVASRADILAAIERGAK